MLISRSLVVLDQRKERRRAKAVIVKERSKVTGPSEAVVKANKKASKPTLEVETSKYRKGDRHLHSDDRDLRKHKRSGHRENEQVSETSSVGPEGDRVLDKHRSRKKRSTDVTRSMAALKDADKGGKATTKRRKDGPLDRARNIVPTGRVTVCISYSIESDPLMSCYTAQVKDRYLQSRSSVDKTCCHQVA